MPIKGDLGSIDLAHVFQLLTLKEEAGVLEVFADGARHLLYFGPKQVSYPYEPRTFLEKVAHLLRRSSKVTTEQVEHARTLAEQSGGDLLQALVQMGVATEADVVRALREQTEE